MSKASDYAARQAAATNEAVSADASAPLGFHCDSCDARVAPDGQCSLTPGTGTGAVALTAADALLLRDWITETFG